MLAAGWRPARWAWRRRRCSRLSAIGYRGAILALQRRGYVMAATFSLAVRAVAADRDAAGLSVAVRAATRCRAILRLWRPSLLAGLTGAAASEFWFLAFALATAASVRTLALIEVLFAQGVSAFRLQAQDHAARSAGHRGPDCRRDLAGDGFSPKRQRPSHRALHRHRRSSGSR